MICRRAPIEPLEPRRLLSAGDLDPAFNGGNVLRIDHPSDEYLNLLGQLSDGRLVLVGETDNGDATAVLQRLADGRPDPTFGVAGRVTVPFVRAIFARDPDSGRIAMESVDDAGMVQINMLDRFGSPDRTFGGSGFADFT